MKKNLNKIFLMALSEPEYARVDFWRAEQKDSKYSKINFVRKLIDAHDDLLHRIESKEAEFKALNPDAGDPNYGLPLVYETDHELSGHVKKSDLHELSLSLNELAKSLELVGDSDNGKKQTKLSFKVDKEEIKLFCHDDFGIEIYQKIKSIFDNDNEAGYAGLKIVTDLAKVAKMFENQPFKVISYVRSYLSNYLSFNSATSEKLLRIIIQILEKRDENKSSGLKLIIAELSSSDFDNPDDSYKEDLSPLETGSEFKGRRTEFFGVEHIDTERYMKGVGVAFGLLKTKKDKFKNFLSEYEDELSDYLGQFDRSTKVNAGSINFESNEEINPIHWLRGKESLRQFLESIKSANLIECRETNEIIQEHFLVDDQESTKKIQPIKWLIESKYLAYLMHRLAEEFVINIKGRKHELTASHFISRDENSLNTNSLASQLSTLLKHAKPTEDNIRSIEKIIQQVKS